MKSGITWNAAGSGENRKEKTEGTEDFLRSLLLLESDGLENQICPTHSLWRPSRRKTGITARGAPAVMVWPPSYTLPVCNSVQEAPAGR